MKRRLRIEVSKKQLEAFKTAAHKYFEIKEIAEIFGISVSRAYAFCYKHEIEYKKNHGRRFTRQSDIVAMVAMYESGAGSGAIAKAFKTNSVNVCCTLKRAGVKMRKSPKRKGYTPQDFVDYKKRWLAGKISKYQIAEEMGVNWTVVHQHFSKLPPPHKRAPDLTKN